MIIIVIGPIQNKGLVLQIDKDHQTLIGKSLACLKNCRQRPMKN